MNNGVQNEQQLNDSRWELVPNWLAHRSTEALWHLEIENSFWVWITIWGKRLNHCSYNANSEWLTTIISVKMTIFFMLNRKTPELKRFSRVRQMQLNIFLSGWEECRFRLLPKSRIAQIQTALPKKIPTTNCNNYRRFRIADFYVMPVMDISVSRQCYSSIFAHNHRERCI